MQDEQKDRTRFTANTAENKIHINHEEICLTETTKREKVLYDGGDGIALSATGTQDAKEQ